MPPSINEKSSMSVGTDAASASNTTGSSVKNRIKQFQTTQNLPTMSVDIQEPRSSPTTDVNIRSGSPLSTSSRSPSNRSAPHPDLSEEVAALSAKLVESLNHQTSIDDNLQTARHELQVAQEKITQLEAAAKEHAELISQGLLVKKEVVEETERKLQTELEAERAEKVSAEKAKKRIELELETLTSSLFEEANGMVVQARKQREATERRNDLLKHQLNDAELLLASHQEQLQDLKARLEHVQAERDQVETALASTNPSTPLNANIENASGSSDMHTALHIELTPADIPPEPPLAFPNLVHPVLRHDIAVYEEFLSLLKSAKLGSPITRGQNSTFSALHLGLGSLSNSKDKDNGTKASQVTTQPQSSALSASNPGSPGNSNFAGDPQQEAAAALAALKENKFYKRAVVEDIEPTLRLDIAPGLSWLARRSVLSGVTVGSLVVEPFPQTTRLYGSGFPCAMCGEVRRVEKFARRHRFRVSEAEDAQRYPLCDYCVARVRSVCDYMGFLRMIKNGHWRIETEDDQRLAWDETVRLRERMFWARIGGGVVPAFSYTTPTSAAFPKSTEDSDQPQIPGSSKAATSTPDVPDTNEKSTSEKPKTGSEETSEISKDKMDKESREANSDGAGDDQEDDRLRAERLESETAEQLRNNVESAIAVKRASISAGSAQTSTAPEKDESLDVKLPGGFD